MSSDNYAAARAGMMISEATGEQTEAIKQLNYTMMRILDELETPWYKKIFRRYEK